MKIEYKNTLKKSLISSRLSSFLFSDYAINIYLTSPRIRKKLQDKRIEVNVVGEKKIQALNKEYREKDKPTDVLTFELYEENVKGGGAGNTLAGEIYLCEEEIRKNAKEQKHGVENEFIEIFIHGLLHMVGYDHEDEMFRWQKILTDEIIKKYEINNRLR